MRKHRQQMDAGEIEALETHIRKMDCLAIAKHGFERMIQKKVTEREIGLCLKHGEVIEVHNDEGEWRALIRLSMGRPRVAVCVVFSVEQSKVVTVWKNAGFDSHKTLDLSQYRAGFDAVEAIRA